MKKAIIHRIRTTEYFPLLLGLILFLSYPLLGIVMPLTEGLFATFFSLFTLLSLSITIHDRRKLRFGLLLAFLTLAPHWLGYFFKGFTIIPLVRVLSILVFTLFIGLELFRQIRKYESVVAETLLAVIIGYMLLGVIGSEICLNLWLLEPESFRMTDANPYAAFQYYSFMTLLTVGYGDIVPLTPPARVVAIFLGIAGQIYLTIVVALFIGKFLAERKF